jgi:hypothetical protein
MFFRVTELNIGLRFDNSGISSSVLITSDNDYLSEVTKTQLGGPKVRKLKDGFTSFTAEWPCRNLGAKSDAKGIVTFQEVAFRGQA